MDLSTIAYCKKHISGKSLSAAGASKDQVPTADGNGNWSWKDQQGVTPTTKTLSSIAVTTQPTKTTYIVGDSFETAGMVVTATYSDETTAEVTGYSYAPSGELAATDSEITITYAEGGIAKTTIVTITVKEAFDLKIVSWADGTVDEISAMLDAHYAGAINISDYWSVGDSRTLEIGTDIVSKGVYVGEGSDGISLNSATNVSLTILDFGRYKMTDDKSAAIVVGFFVNLSSSTRFCLDLDNHKLTESSSATTWGTVSARTNLNSKLSTMLPTLSSLVKTVKVTYNDTETSEDKIFIPSPAEIVPKAKLDSSSYTMETGVSQLEYFQTYSNKDKVTNWTYLRNNKAETTYYGYIGANDTFSSLSQSLDNFSVACLMCM